MCGRFVLYASPDAIAALFDLDAATLPALEPRYNIAPTQSVAIVRAAPEGGGRELAFARWGLVPSWAKDASGAARMINARSETVAEKPAFRAAFKRRRCLVPADGFYEWRTEGGRKQPYYIHAAGDGPLAIAGLWEVWRAPDGAPVESCTLLTTDADDLVRPLHDRMPVILEPADFDRWLDPAESEPRHLMPLLAPADPAHLALHPVDPRVNSVRFDDPACIAPLAGHAGLR